MASTGVLSNPTLQGSKVNKRTETIEGGRQKRRSSAETSRKEAREKLVDKKRRIPLDDVPENTKTERKTKSDKRKEQLKIWQEERKKQKCAMEKKLKKTFVVRHVVHSPARYLVDKSKKKMDQQQDQQQKQPRRTVALRTNEGKEGKTIKTRKSDVNTIEENKEEENDTAHGNDHTQAFDPPKATDFQKFVFNYRASDIQGNFSFLSQTQGVDPIAAFNRTQPEEEKRTSFISVGGDPFSPENPSTVGLLEGLNSTVEELNPFVSRLESEENVQHSPKVINEGGKFRSIVRNETEKLVGLCSKWELILEEEPGLPEYVIGDIRAATGQAKLLMDKRFEQFSGLIDLHENKSGEKETRASDLDGFWNVIYFQVEDVYKKFENIEAQKNRNWEPLEVPKKRRGKKAVRSFSESASKPVPKRKNNFQKFRMEMKAKLEAEKGQQNEDFIGFVNVLTPMKSIRKGNRNEDGDQPIILTSVKRSTRKRKSIVPELDFTSEPTYVLSQTLFEDCIKSNSSEWPMAVVNEKEEPLEPLENKDFKNVDSILPNLSPSCVDGISLLRLESPAPHNLANVDKPYVKFKSYSESDKGMDSPFSMRYLIPTKSPETASSGTKPISVDTVPEKTPSRTLRPRKSEVASNLILFSP